MPKWLIGALTAASAAAAEYWHGAPALLHYAVYALGPLLLLESISALWMQRSARHIPDDVKVVVYAGDTWGRAGTRFGMTALLVCLGGAVDAITGTQHMTVLWVLLWGVAGHARATLRHLETIAQINHMHLPIFPQQRIEQIEQRMPQVPTDPTPGERHE